MVSPQVANDGVVKRATTAARRRDGETGPWTVDLDYLFCGGFDRDDNEQEAERRRSTDDKDSGRPIQVRARDGRQSQRAGKGGSSASRWSRQLCLCVPIRPK